MKTKNLFGKALLVALTLSVFTGCGGGDDSSSNTPNANASGGGGTGGDNTLPDIQAPSLVGNAVLWLKADTGVLTDSDGVTTWADQSQSGLTCENGTLAGHDGTVTSGPAISHPSYKARGQGGRPSVTFNGSGGGGTAENSIFCNGNSIASSTGFTVITVTNGTADGSDGWVVSDTNYAFSAGTTPTTLTGTLNGPSSTSVSASTSSALGSNQIVTYEFSLTSNQIFVAGQNSSSSTGSLTSRNTGGDFQIGRRLVGDISEIIIFSSVLSDSDRQTVECYLGTKYGFTVASCN